ncbi:MAG: M48 family metalloprotease, partial [Candidatus Binatia bacterium]
MKYVPKICLAGAIVMLITAPWDAETSGKERGRHRDSRSRVEHESARIHAIMLPLLRNTDRRLPLDQIRVSIIDDPAINAGSGGNGEFFVTTGLLNQATDEQLRGVLAHEVAHEDLGHPMKAQVLGTGLGLGAALLEQIMPGSGAVAPIAGTLITGHYTRPMELAADRHAVK